MSGPGFLLMDKRAVIRKLFHFSSASIPLCYLLAGKGAALIFAATLLVLSAGFEYLRIRGKIDTSLIRKYMQIKDAESVKPTGSFFYLLAVPLTILFFRETIAVASLFVVALADPLSSIAGQLWGRSRVLGKSIEGSSVFFVVSFFILSVFCFPLPVRVAAALVATLVELFTPKWLDDNLTIPLITGAALPVFSA